MGEIFLKVLNMSIAASWLILAVMLLRFVLKRAPKWIAILLWGIVALRLAVPFSFESALSLIPSAETFNAHNIQYEMPAISSGIPAVNNAVNPVLGETFAPVPGGSVNPLYVWTFVMSVVWLAGIAAMLLYAAISYVRVHRSVAERVPYEGNFFLCDHVKSPFILGLVAPKIYLPSNVDGVAMESVIAHEKAHLARRDHWWKPMGFLILTVHWFNPLCWIAYVLLCRDIELACDEKVIRQMDLDGKKQYSTALLECSAGRRLVTICPLTFGEIGVSERVRNVLSYKKPAFWVIAVAVIACAVVTVCFATNPVTAYHNTANTTVPVMQNVVKEIGGEKLHTGVELSTDDAEAITEIIDNGTWIETTPNCVMNCSINLNGRLYHYCSDYGILEEVVVSEKSYLSAKVPEKNNKSLELSATQKDVMNAILEKYITLDSDVVSRQEPLNIEELRVKYPEYFELITSKGLEVYVWQMAENDYRFGLMPGTNREKILDELLALKGATTEEMALILSTYKIEDKSIFVIPWQNPISSYMVTEDMAKDPEYINSIRAMLGLDGVSISSTVNDVPKIVEPEPDMDGELAPEEPNGYGEPDPEEPNYSNPADTPQAPTTEPNNGTTESATGIFDALNKLEYQPYTCDGIPEYRLYAADGTVYFINFSENWVWRGNSEQADLSAELISQLIDSGMLIGEEKPVETP